MRKSLHFFVSIVLLVSLVGLSSCKKENQNGVTFTATMEDCADVHNAKTVLNGTALEWVAGDEIKIHSTSVAVFTATPLNPATEATFTTTDASFNDGGSYIAFYPAANNSTYDRITLPATQVSEDGSLRGFPMYAWADGTTNLQFRNLCGVLKLNLQKTGMTVASIALTVNSPINGDYTLQSQFTNEATLATSPSSGTGSNTTTLVCNQSINTPHDFYIYLPAGTYSGLTLEITTNDGRVCTKGPATSSVVIERSKYSTLTLGGDNLEFFDPSDWVDLGLPSGLLWATRNVGATSPEDYGDYFAWGETTTKSLYLWSTYIYCNGEIEEEDYDHLTKYCNNSSYGYNGFTDNLTILQPGDDAATANYGGRTPTKEEWQELINNTTAQWTTRNGVNGRLFTSSNGNSLFLPAAGYRWDSSLNFAGSRGFYWSSSLDTDDPSRARIFGFLSNFQGVNRGNRDDGLSVRAVRSAQ